MQIIGLNTTDLNAQDKPNPHMQASCAVNVQEGEQEGQQDINMQEGEQIELLMKRKSIRKKIQNILLFITVSVSLIPYVLIGLYCFTYPAAEYKRDTKLLLAEYKNITRDRVSSRCFIQDKLISDNNSVTYVVFDGVYPVGNYSCYWCKFCTKCNLAVGAIYACHYTADNILFEAEYLAYKKQIKEITNTYRSNKSSEFMYYLLGIMFGVGLLSNILLLMLDNFINKCVARFVK